MAIPCPSESTPHFFLSLSPIFFLSNSSLPRPIPLFSDAWRLLIEKFLPLPSAVPHFLMVPPSPSSVIEVFSKTVARRSMVSVFRWYATPLCVQCSALSRGSPLFSSIISFVLAKYFPFPPFFPIVLSLVFSLFLFAPIFYDPFMCSPFPPHPPRIFFPFCSFFQKSRRTLPSVNR